MQHVFSILTFTLVVALLHSMSAHCGARSNTVVASYVSNEIGSLRDDLGLDPYPGAQGIKVGDVEFR